MHIHSLKNNKTADSIILFTAGILYVWGISASIISSYEFTMDYRMLFIHTMIVLIILRLITINKYIFSFVLFVTIMTCMFIVFDKNSNTDLINAYDEMKQNVTMTIRYITGYVTYMPDYGNMIAGVVLMGISIFSVLFIFLSFQFYVLLIISFVITGLCLFSGSLHYHLAFYSYMVGIFILLIRYMSVGNFKRISKKNCTNSTKMTAIYLLPIIVLCFIAAYFLPKPNNKAVEKALNSIMAKPFEKIDDFFYPYFSQKYYSLKNSGFMGRSNRLGGDIKLNNRVVMEVEPNHDSGSTLYLAGAIKDEYTGYSWENSKTDYESYDINGSPSIDLLELSFSNMMMSFHNGEFVLFAKILEDNALILNTVYEERITYIPDSIFTIEMQLSVYKERKATITMKDSKTFSVFTLPITTSIDNLNNDLILKRTGTGNIITENIINTNESYTITYRTNPAVQYFKSIPSYSRKGIYEEMYKRLGELHMNYDFTKEQISVNLDEELDRDPYNLHMLNMYPAGEAYFNKDKSISYEELLENTLMPRAARIYDEYLKLPEQLPNRVIKLTEDITAMHDSPYFKASSISAYLKRYPYTLTPGEVPKDRDFVDYFLFDGQKGYCVYYASAFVVMCRAVGIPARYVEGYVTPPMKSENGTYVVTNKQAHAWAEIYLEGYGWYTYDPTSSTYYNDATVFSDDLTKDYPADSETIIDYNEMEAKKDRMVNEKTDRAADVRGEAAYHMMYNKKTLYNAEVPSMFSVIRNRYNLQKPVKDTFETDLTQGITIKMIVYRFLLSIFLLFFIFTAVIGIRYYVKYSILVKKIKEGCNEAVIQYYLLLKECLAEYGYKQSEQETYMEFAVRVSSEKRLSENGIDINSVIEIFTRAYYGGKRITENEKIIMENTLKNIKCLMLNDFGRIKYYYMRLLSKNINKK